MSGGMPPELLEEYRLVRFLGEGAMGQVYLYRDTRLDRDVAVKFISRPNELSRQRFAREARAIARLQHPNIVAIYRSGEYAEWPYIVQEFIQGESLAASDMPMSWQRAYRLGLALARGLAEAHRAGVLHRDIKPGNIMMASNGAPKLVDFGLAKLIALDEPRTHEHSQNPALDEPVVSNAQTPTRRTQLMGTSYYLAPELWDGQAASKRSDVYAMGVVLFQMCTGNVPFDDVPELELARAVKERELPSIASLAPDMNTAFSRIIERCLHKEPGQRYASSEQLRDALAAVEGTGMWQELPDGCPYLGLLAFESKHSGLFFGRRAETREVTERLEKQQTLFVAGESGAGKSSLICAGVLPHIAARGVGDGRSWSVCAFTPRHNPMRTLVSELARRLGEAAAYIERDLKTSHTAVIDQLQKRHGRNAGTVFFIDQMEELVTVSKPEEARQVCELLAGIIEHVPSTRLVATVRGDHLIRVATLPGLGSYLECTLYFLRPLGESGIRDAIVEPARVVGFDFESPGMVDALVSATKDAASGLPLLQFALLQLWEHRDAERAVLPERALTDIGGVQGALAQHAEQVWRALVRDDTRTLARAILLRLVTVHRTRVPETQAALLDGRPERQRALDRLCQGRLIVAREIGGEPVFELSHEALITAWPRLARWLHSQGDRRIVLERLAIAAREWQGVRHRRENLWRGEQVQEASDIEADKLPALDREFLLASRRAAIRTRRLRWAAVILVLATSLFGYATVKYLQARNIANLVAQAERHRRAGNVLTRQMQTKRRAAFEVFNVNLTDEGERARNMEQANAIWSEALSLARHAQHAFTASRRKLDDALRIDANDTTTRRDLIALLDRLIRLADLRGETTARDEFIADLQHYDESGATWHKWTRARAITLTTAPARLPVELCRYRRSTDGRISCESVPAPTVAQRHTPTTWQLAPGSYRFHIPASPAHCTAEVYVPFRVPYQGGDSPLSGSLHIPAKSAVPDGYVYIPPGKYLRGFGGTEHDEPVRRWYEAMPLHEHAIKEPYLIAAHEVTYADWLRYVEANPAQDLLPHRSAEPNGDASVELSRLAYTPGYRLSLTIGGETSEASPGAWLTYRGRTHNHTQDWQKLPITGLTGEEIHGYLHWLDASGRVPGARLCMDDEWERAARGADERVFPHGDRLRYTDANFDETYGKREGAFGLDEVGSYPQSASPFGILDMAGNARELTRSRANPQALFRRGGSYFLGRSTNAIVNRDFVIGSQEFARTGFRVCADYPTPSRAK